MPKADTQTAVTLLLRYSRRSALRGENPYRARAYARAADSLAALAEPLEDLIAGGRLQEIPGIGDAIAAIITEMHRTGSHPNSRACERGSRLACWKCWTR